MSDKTWKVLELLNTTAAYFKDKQIENPRLNAEQLLCKVLDMQRVDLYVAFDRPVTPSELSIYRQLVKRRAAREPLQYILEETEFYGLPFTVTPQVLIPRPETELLVEQVLALHNEFKENRIVIADIGTGSGCIAVSLAKNWPQSRLIATDISDRALDIAAANGTRNNMDTIYVEEGQSAVWEAGSAPPITLVKQDIFNDWPQWLAGRVDILVSNPPYIAKAEMAALQPEVKDYEPSDALTDHHDGLSFYRRLFQLAVSENGPGCRYMLLEMSGSQPQAIIEECKQFPFQSVKTHNDLNDIPRILKIKVK